MRRYFTSHLPISLAYGLVVMAINGSWWPFTIPHLLQWMMWLIGVIIGVLLLFLDRIAYTYAYPEEQLSQQFQWFIKNKQYLRAVEVLDSRRMEQERLTFRSALFMVIWVPLALFALTSTVGLFGKGVVMGLMLHIVTDSWRMHKLNPEGLNRRLFWQIKRAFSKEERVIFLSIITGIFLFFSFWIR